MQEKPIKLEAQVIDESSPIKLAAADKFLSSAVALIAKREKAGDLIPYEVTSEELYAQAKRDRASIRQDIAALDAERKSLTKAIDDVLASFKARSKTTLAPLSETEQHLKEQINAWDLGRQARRRAHLEEFYEDFAPDLVPLVPFEKLEEVYSCADPKRKWYLKSTGDKAAEESLEAAVKEIADKEQSIGLLPYSAEVKKEVKQLFFSTLDLAEAIRQVQKAQEQREHLEALERERLEREKAAEEAAQKAEQEGREAEVREAEVREAAAQALHKSYEERTAEPESAPAAMLELAREPEPEFSVQEVQAQDQRLNTYSTYEFRATMNEVHLEELKAYLRKNQVHAVFRKVK